MALLSLGRQTQLWTKIALIMIARMAWFPYIYVLTLGILQSIPNDLYEAAYIDGANAWQKFRNITFPMILAVAAPTLISQYTFNFNNFSIMYLFNGEVLVALVVEPVQLIS